jgi:membrane-associated phospholipid phosphatase
MLRKISLLLAICLCLQISVLKAEKRDSCIVKTVIVHGLNDTKSWVLSPLKWDAKGWLVFGGISAATGSLIAWADQPIYTNVNKIPSKTLDKVAIGLEPAGYAYPIAAIAGFMVHGLIAKDNYSVETSLIASESIFLSTLLVQGVKYTCGRSRPDKWGTGDSHNWGGPFSGGNSFFSGHTTAAFSVASVIAYRYRDTKWVPIVSYGLATLGGLERIYDNRHWASDVLMGATVGTATGILLCKQWEKNSIQFFPTVTTNGAGLSVVIPIR